jgi:hypothetical protein
LAVQGECETVPGTGEVARFPAETLGTHKEGGVQGECVIVCVCGGGRLLQVELSPLSGIVLMLLQAICGFVQDQWC